MIKRGILSLFFISLRFLICRKYKISMIYYADLQSTLKTFLLMSILKQNKKFFQSPPTLSNKAIENWLIQILVIGKAPIYVTRYKVFQESQVTYSTTRGYTKIVVVDAKYKYNIIGPDDKLLSPIWYDWIGNYEKGFRILKDGQQNYMKKDGTLLSPKEWFSKGYDGHFSDNHDWLLVKRKGGGENYINLSSGKFLSQTDFLKGTAIREGFGRVKLQNGKWNFIDLEGNLLLHNTSYENVHSFREGYAVVIREGDGMYNFIDLKGNTFSETWYDVCDDFREGFAKVFTDPKGIRFIKNTGEFLNTPFFEDAGSFCEGLARVKPYGKGWNYLKKDGSILLPGKNFSWCSSFENGQAEVCDSGNYYNIDHEGKKVS